MAIILGIESSCDETSASICINGEIHSNVIATQAIHAKYGGVIPELINKILFQQWKKPFAKQK
jgi:N6-L-threonylcarbamoyladenine synthase